MAVNIFNNYPPASAPLHVHLCVSPNMVRASHRDFQWLSWNLHMKSQYELLCMLLCYCV